MTPRGVPVHIMEKIYARLHEAETAYVPPALLRLTNLRPPAVPAATSSTDRTADPDGAAVLAIVVPSVVYCPNPCSKCPPTLSGSKSARVRMPVTWCALYAGKGGEPGGQSRINRWMLPAVQSTD